MRTRSCAHQHTSPRSRFYTVTRSASAFRSDDSSPPTAQSRVLRENSPQKRRASFIGPVRSIGQPSCLCRVGLPAKPTPEEKCFEPTMVLVCLHCCCGVSPVRRCTHRALLFRAPGPHATLDRRHPRAEVRTISRPARLLSMPAGRTYGARRTNFISSISKSLVTSTSSRAWTPSRRRINGRSRA